MKAKLTATTGGLSLHVGALLCLVFWLHLDAAAEDPTPTLLTPAEITFFESKVRPVLIEHCYACHSAGADVAEGELRVDTHQSLRRGGSSGAAIVPGNAEASLLFMAITHEDPDQKMPPKKPRLSAGVIADLKKWIEMGAPDPRIDDPSPGGPANRSNAPQTHWAYQPLRTSAAVLASGDEPESHAAISPLKLGIEPARIQSWQSNPIDRHLLRAMMKQGLAPSADAPIDVLVRRLYFDLIGLPPSKADFDRFVNLSKSSGLERAMGDLVDRLLASPQYGEHWGRHWLDVARYGESSGKEANITFPYAWRYRDYVIDAFNQDIPYDRFITEQIAGDHLSFNDESERARLLIATGFLALGPKNLDEANLFQFYADLIDEQIDTTTRSIMASSVACARCHDHKFDPFSMRDYYALAGVFASTETFFGTSISPSNRVGGQPLPLPRNAGHKIFHASVPATKVKALKDELVALQQEEKRGRAAIQKAVQSGEDPSEGFTLTDALRIFWRTGAIHAELNRVSAAGEALPLGMGVMDRKSMIDIPLLHRGDISKPGETIPRSFPALVVLDDPVAIPPNESGRRQLAQWLSNPQNPLTSRVMVNRIWKHLFGNGIVSTVDDFGTTGQPPSHPELLDHLALRLIAEGWSVKRLIRELVLTKAYQQASDYRESAFQIDPDNRLLWRQSKRRLGAEAIRDAMLSSSGEIDLRRPEASLVGRVIGDRPVSLIGLDKRLRNDLDGTGHRSIYLPVIRDRLPDALDLFDYAEPSLVTGQRETTNVPTQALYLMNSLFIQTQAEAMARRAIRESDTEADRITLVFQWCFNRVPDTHELHRSQQFLQSLKQSTEKPSEASKERSTVSAASTPWGVFCQAMLATAEFRNLD